MKQLTSPWIALIGVILVLLATVKHSVLVYIQITGTPETWYHFLYIALMVLSIDAVVIIFSVHGHKRASPVLIRIMNQYLSIKL